MVFYKNFKPIKYIQVAFQESDICKVIKYCKH